MKKIAVCVLTLLLFCMNGIPLLLAQTAEAHNKTYSETNALADTAEAPEGMQLAAQDGDTELYLDPETTRFAVRTDGFYYYSGIDEDTKDADDLIAGAALGASTSLMVINVTDPDAKSVEEYASARESVRDGVFKISYISQNGVQTGFRIEFTFDFSQVTVPLEITLENGHLSACVPVDEVVHGKDDTVLMSVELLPYFGSVGIHETGYMLVPDGCGAVIEFNNGKTSGGAYDAPVYGGDKTFVQKRESANAEMIRLPVFGMKREGTAFLAIIEKGDALARIFAQVSGIDSRQNSIRAKFILKSLDTFGLKELSGQAVDMPVIDSKLRKYGNLEISYRFLTGDKANYTDMAEEYQRYLFGETEKPEAAAASMLLDFYGAVNKKQSVAGIPLTVKKELTSLEKAYETVEKLTSQGLAEPVTRFQFVTDGQINRKPDKALSVLGKLGGDKAFGEASYITANAAETKGSFLQLGGTHVKNNMNMPAYQYSYDLLSGLQSSKFKRYYLLTPESVKKNFEKMIDSQKGKHAKQHISLLDIGNTLYSSFGSRYSSPEDTKNTFANLMKYAKDKNINIMAEGGNAYALPYVSMISGAPVSSNRYTMTDYDIPFYQLVTSGYVPCVSRPVNMMSNPQRQFLKCLETGSLPSFAVIGGEPSVLQGTQLEALFGADFSKWEDTIVRTGRQAAEVFQNGNSITGYRSIAPEVSETTYANGLKVIVNYGTEAYVYEGQAVQSMDYILL